MFFKSFNTSISSSIYPLQSNWFPYLLIISLAKSFAVCVLLSEFTKSIKKSDIFLLIHYFFSISIFSSLHILLPRSVLLTLNVNYMHFVILFCNITISAVNCVLAGSHVPIASLRNSIPLRFRAVVLDCCQAAATPERPIAYRGNTTADCYTCQPNANIKRHFAYRRNAIWNCYTCQAAATPERRIAYRRDASVYRYHTVFATQNQCFACGFDNTIPLAVVFSIAYSNFYACQAAATTERKITYSRDAVTNCYVCQAAATPERTINRHRDFSFLLDSGVAFIVTPLL